MMLLKSTTSNFLKNSQNHQLIKMAARAVSMTVGQCVIGTDLDLYPKKAFQLRNCLLAIDYSFQNRHIKKWKVLKSFRPPWGLRDYCKLNGIKTPRKDYSSFWKELKYKNPTAISKSRQTYRWLSVVSRIFNMNFACDNKR